MRSVWSYERRCAASESTSFAVLMRWKRSAASGALFLSGWYLPQSAPRAESEGRRGGRLLAQYPRERARAAEEKGGRVWAFAGKRAAYWSASLRYARFTSAALAATASPST